MISVVIVDDHPAIRMGLRAALETEPELTPVGAASTAAELGPLLYSCRPDVVLIDFNLPDADGLKVCRELKATLLPPAVILYSAFADGSMTIPAIVAGADAIVHKGVPASNLFAAIRDVAAGRAALPPVTRDQMHAASAALDEIDLPLLSILVEGIKPQEIAETLHLDLEEVNRRIDRVLGRLTGAVHYAPTTPPR